MYVSIPNGWDVNNTCFTIASSTSLTATSSPVTIKNPPYINRISRSTVKFNDVLTISGTGFSGVTDTTVYMVNDCGVINANVNPGSIASGQVNITI